MLMIDGKEYEVLPCPFCGSSDRIDIESKKDYEDLYAKHGGACLRISCERCHIDMYEHKVIKCDYHAKAQALLQKWNRRCVYGTDED